MYPIQSTICFVRIDCKVIDKLGRTNYLSRMLNNNEKVEIGCMVLE